MPRQARDKYEKNSSEALIPQGNHTGIRRHIMRRDGFVGVEAGYGGAHLPQTQWPQMLTIPLRVPNASKCASGDVELRANLLSGVGGGAYFQLERANEPFTNFTFAESVLLRGMCPLRTTSLRLQRRADVVGDLLRVLQGIGSMVR